MIALVLRTWQSFLAEPSSPLTLAFVLGVVVGGGAMYFAAYRRWRKARRSRHLVRLDALRETSHFEQEE